MATFRIQATLKNKSALASWLTIAEKQAISYMEQQVENMIRIAAEHTPRYSGAATLGWRVTLDKSKANAVGESGNESRELKYEGGINDAKSQAAINTVVGYNRLISWNIAAKIHKEKDTDVRFYLYNKQAYAREWLEDNAGIRERLRDVNKDFWTMQQIQAAVAASGKRIKNDFSKGKY